MNLSSRDEQTLNIGILNSPQVDRTGVALNDERAGGVHFDSDALGILATDNLDAGFGVSAHASLDRRSLSIGRDTAHKRLSRRLQVKQSGLVRPVKGLSDAVAVRVELLCHRSSGNEASQHLEVGASLDTHERSAVVRSQARRRQSSG